MALLNNNGSFKRALGGLVISLCLIACSADRHEPARAVPPASVGSDIQAMPIWTTAVPDSGLIRGAEVYNDGMVSNVSRPTIAVYPPKGKNTGAAVLVFPGGGYNKLAIDLEGSEIYAWLSSQASAPDFSYYHPENQDLWPATGHY